MKYFEISLTSFCDLARIRRERVETKVDLIISFPLMDTCGLATWGLNFDLTLLLKVDLLLFTKKLSQ